jgi:predicted DNA-binding protein (MmcQ/YjbR family)
VPKFVTTAEELDSFGLITKLLGPEAPVEYEDTASYFKLHVAGKRTWVVSRLQLDRKQPLLSVPMPADKVAPLVGGRQTSTAGVWTSVVLESVSDIAALRELVRAAYSTVVQERTKGGAEEK